MGHFRMDRAAVLAIVCGAVAVGDVCRADVLNMPSGQTSLQFVPIGNAGNPNDPLTGNVFGGVAYTYAMSKFSTTVGQYTQFLNTVAASDPYGLYNPNMATRTNVAGIVQSGVSGSFTYSTIDSPNKPIAYIGWGDAARFAN